MWSAVLVLIMVGPFAGLLGLFGILALRHRGAQLKVGDDGSSVCFVFVVPAHNEGGTIARTLSSLQTVDYPKDLFQIVVIADNCSDGTAKIAREMGVTVYERHHAIRRSKGFALEDTLPTLLSDTSLKKFSAFVIVDADTVVDVNALRALAPFLRNGSDWIQGLDLVDNPLESWRTKLLAYGFSLFNGSFQVGSEALGLGAHLRGNGMCLSRKGLERIAWKAGGLAEDLEFSWKLRLAGECVSFASNAKFYADMPVSAKASTTQRRRWEKGRHGLWQSLRSQLVDAPGSVVVKILWALDLTMPSLTVVVGMLILSMFLLAIAAVSGVVVPTWLSTIYVLLSAGLLAYGISPFFSFELPWSVISAVLMLPYYAIWRLVIALGRLPTSWVRTERRP